jgi:quercetin dioxygenase-like cupin family protein
MAQKGQIMDCPETGETFEMVETAQETGGRYTRMKVTLQPGSLKPVMHLHESGDETFEVISGKLSYQLGQQQGIIGPGEKVWLPKGIPHTHYNAENEPLVVYQTIAPALDFEVFIETFCGLLNDGRFKNGQPPFLQIMLWIQTLQSKTFLAAIPVGVQKTLALLLTPPALLLGYRKTYAKYSAPPTPPPATL